MAVTVSPTYPIAGQPIVLGLTAASGTVAAFAITTRPSASTLRLGYVMRETDLVLGVRVVATLSYVGGDVLTERPARILRTSGDFLAEGLRAGMAVAVSGTTANDGTYIITSARERALEFSETIAFTLQTVSSTLEAYRGSYPLSLEALAIADRIGYETTFDEPGEYTLIGHDVRELHGSASFEGDTAERRFSLLGTQTTVVHVGALLDLPVFTERGDGGTLRLQVNDETIRGATVEGTTEVGRVALLDSGVQAALTALVGQTVATIGGVFVDRVENLRVNLNAHVDTLAPFHGVTDPVNDVELYQPVSQQAGIDVLNHLRENLVGHLRHRTTGIRPHTNDDETSLPATPIASTLAQATVLLADLRERVYERHRVLGTGTTPVVHVNAAGDITNFLTAPTLLDNLLVAYIDAIVTASLAAVAGEAEGAADLAHMLGFKLVS